MSSNGYPQGALQGASPGTDERAHSFGMRASGQVPGAASAGYYQAAVQGGAQGVMQGASQVAAKTATQGATQSAPQTATPSAVQAAAQGGAQTAAQGTYAAQTYAQPQWFQGPDGTQYMMGPDGRLYPVVSQPNQNGQEKKKHRVGFWVAIILAIVCIAVAVVIAFTMCSEKPKRSGELGSVAGMSQEEIRDELDRIVQNGMFDISIAAMAQFPDGTSEGELKIENPENNNFLMTVDITRDDTGESIYATDMIEPGYVVYSDKLSTDLPAGTYPCTATFTAYDEDEQEVGVAAAKITIVVQS